jgi:hypothetical protein
MSEQNTEPVRVKWSLPAQEGQFTIDRGEWDELTPEARHDLLDEMYRDEVSNHVNGNAWPLNADLNDPVKD